jgi:hypothetical protein
MPDAGLVGGLSGALLGIASDPSRIDTLHRILDRYFHRFRNRLNSMKLSLYLAKKQAAEGDIARWAELEARYRVIEQFLDQVQTLCRPIHLNPIRESLGKLLEERLPAWVQWHVDRGRRLEVTRPDGPAVGSFDPSRLGQAVDALVAWRAEVGDPETPAHLSWWEDGGSLHLSWAESGSGRPAHGAPSHRCSSLALPLLARVVTAHGGTLDISEREGLRFLLRWPANPAHPRTRVDDGARPTRPGPASPGASREDRLLLPLTEDGRST